MLVQEKNNKGLSLLELIVVLSIVGILSAVAYPNFSSWYKEREVRQAAVKIHALMKNIAIQTEKGTFGYVQVLFSNDDDNLIVSSKGMTMQTLSTKINDGTDPWNTDMTGESRCNVTDTNYWDTDLATASSELKNSVYSITLSDVTTNFEGTGAICFSRNGKFYEGSDELAESTSVPYEFFFVCRITSSQNRCPISFGASGPGDDGDELKAFEEGGEPEESSEEQSAVLPIPTAEAEYLRAIRWGRFGNFSIKLFNNNYTITTDPDTGKKVKMWIGGSWRS